MHCPAEQVPVEDQVRSVVGETHTSAGGVVHCTPMHGSPDSHAPPMHVAPWGQLVGADQPVQPLGSVTQTSTSAPEHWFVFTVHASMQPGPELDAVAEPPMPPIPALDELAVAAPPIPELDEVLVLPPVPELDEALDVWVELEPQAGQDARTSAARSGEGRRGRRGFMQPVIIASDGPRADREQGQRGARAIAPRRVATMAVRGFDGEVEERFHCRSCSLAPR